MEIQTETLQSQSYLTFKLDDEMFAASVINVIEILELSKITKVPCSPHFMRGVINLRGSVLPVIDTRIKFGLSKAEDTINTCIMVITLCIEHKQITIGAMVDAVHEVIEIDSAQIQAPPTIGSTYNTTFIDGMLKVNDHFIMILNIDLVFNPDELSTIRAITSEN